MNSPAPATSPGQSSPTSGYRRISDYRIEAAPFRGRGTSTRTEAYPYFTAGLMEWKKGNTDGLAAYGPYGQFWFSFAAFLLLPAFGLGEEQGVRGRWLHTSLSGGCSHSLSLSGR